MDAETQARAKRDFKRDIARLVDCKRPELLPTINEVVNHWQIERVEYGGKKFNCTVRYEGEQIILSAKIEGQKCEHLAALIYNQLQERGIATPGGVHINRNTSTKHYKSSFNNMVAKYVY